MSGTYAPIELPPQGHEEKVQSAFPTVFNWDYQIDHAELMRLYDKGKSQQWNASKDIDWSIDVDPERIRLEDTSAVDAILNPPQKLERKERSRMNHHMNAWMLSQFMHGEQGALVATAAIVNTVP